MDLKLQGKRALVTGSGDGIGAAIAKTLAEEGVAVVVHGRREAQAREVAGAVIAAGGKAAMILGDVVQKEGAGHVATATMAALGGIDIVVNNVGASLPDDWSIPNAGRWLDAYNQNVVSTVRMIHHSVPHMRQQGWGRFIQIADVRAGRPQPMAPAKRRSST